MTRETQRGDYRPRATLAFLSHALTPELTVRAGRLRSPFFMLSDTADINYNQTWVRPPTEVYGLNPFADLDGVDLLHRSRIGETFIEVHPYVGRSRVPVIGGGRARLDDLMGVRVTIEAGRLSLSAGHAKADLAVRRSSAGYLAFIDRVGLPAALQERLSGSGADASFSSLGLQWDDGRWLVSAELARTTASAFTNSATGAYLAVGRRVGTLTPYLSLARQWQDDPLVDPAEAGAYAAVLAPFNRSRNQAQRSVTTGVRWDFLHNAALKAEFTHVQTARDAHGTFIARDNPFAPGLAHRAARARCAGPVLGSASACRTARGRHSPPGRRHRARPRDRRTAVPRQAHHACRRACRHPRRPAGGRRARPLLPAAHRQESKPDPRLLVPPGVHRALTAAARGGKHRRCPSPRPRHSGRNRLPAADGGTNPRTAHPAHPRLTPSARWPA